MNLENIWILLNFTSTIALVIISIKNIRTIMNLDIEIRDLERKINKYQEELYELKSINTQMRGKYD